MWGCCLAGQGCEFSLHQRQIFPTLVLACFSDRISLQAAHGLSAKGLLAICGEWLWFSGCSIYNYLNLCRLIMVRVCCKWETRHLFTASSHCCPSSQKCGRFSEAAANEQSSRCAPQQAAVSPPVSTSHCPCVISGPLWELLREHPGFILQLHAGATGALGQVMPYMDAETPGQASRKGSAPLRADVVLSVRRITENGDGERFERRDRERRTWRKKRKFSLHEIYLSCHIIKKTMIMIRLMDDCPMKSNFSMNTNENLSVMTHFN